MFSAKNKQKLIFIITNGGKKKSKYVDDALVDDLRAKIERRRELQKREKELTFMFPKPQKTEKQEDKKHIFTSLLSEDSNYNINCTKLTKDEIKYLLSENN